MVSMWQIVALAAATRGSQPGQISVSVQNMVGRDVVLSWLQPGRAPRARVSQHPNKPFKNSSVMAIDSFETHEFVVEAAAPGAAGPPDGHEQCAFWASVGECDANPSYMRTSCKRACAAHEAKATGDSNEAFFAVADAPETITVRVGDDGKWIVERSGPTHDAKAAVAKAFEDCDVPVDAETCAGDPIACITSELDAFFAPKRAELELETQLFEASVDLAPNATPDPEAKAPYREDLVELRRSFEKARKPVDLEAACPSAERPCLFKKASDNAVGLENAIAGARKATRARRHDKRNATCARHTDWTPHEPALKTEWVWEPAADAALWGSEGPPADVPGTERSRQVTSLFRPDALPKAAIALIDNFLSDEECDAVVAQATPRLARATHAHEGDLTHVSKARNSQQATVRPAGGARNTRDLSDPIARLKARSVGFANWFSNYSLGVEGQEDIMAVQYNPGQEYMLHCDGSCDGTPFVAGGRLATVLMYCEAADGGGTSFPNANVHVVPHRGQAVYFHFRAPEADSVMEDWHTEHSGCPVREGSKWVITQWLRDGVSKENPHTRFDPSGGPVGRA
mmetsp:Transcript_77/g.246  ORF Transcript_77/g.246 Transcript_77/m.246 type:complete len:572 (-) Transcript_77:28-1743(-)